MNLIFDMCNINSLNIIKLGMLYLLCNLFVLINYQGIYWDDWTLYNVETQAMLHQFDMSGAKYFGYFHKYLLSVGNGVFLYRVLMLLTYFMTGVFLYKILQHQFVRDSNSAFYISAIYLSIPFNTAKIALINVPAIFCLFFFSLAFFLFCRSVHVQNNLYVRLIILVLFFISFLLNSLLVFYAIVLIYIIYFEYITHGIKREKDDLMKLIKIVLVNYLDFILLPFAFYFYKSVYMVQYDIYSNYNIISFDFHRIYNLILDSIVTSPYELIVMSFGTSMSLVYITIIIAVLIFPIIKEKYPSSDSRSLYYKVLFFGIVAYILAVLPYAVVNKLPQFSGWESRHQVLMSFSVSFIVYSLIMMVSNGNKKMQNGLFLIILTVFTTQNIINGYGYLKDWYYQVSIEENFKYSMVIKDNSTFIVDVKLDGSLANERHFRFYELNALLKAAYGDDGRLMVSKSANIDRYKKYNAYKQYNFSSWKYADPIFILLYKNPKFEDNVIAMFELFYYQVTNDAIFRSVARKMIIIENKKV